MIEQIADLLGALARLAVPLVVLIVILIFKKEISGLLKRIVKGKILGQEFEFDQRLEMLKEHISEGQKEILIQGDMLKKGIPKQEEVNILEKAKDQPLEALARIRNLVEQELVDLMAAKGFSQYLESGFSFHKAITLLQNRENITKSTANSLRQFYDLTNNILRAQIETSEDELIRLIDLGSMLLNLIRAIPRETYEVYKPNVELYRDKECKVKYEDVTGLILRVISPGGTKEDYRIYPTTRNYLEAQILSWEWNLDKSWGEAWYRDPLTNEIKLAWSRAGEFVGRPLQEIPGEWIE
ncbi:MAG: hypothetical protein WBC70_13320 [Candidatus Aminicenantales bacterium]